MTAVTYLCVSVALSDLDEQSERGEEPSHHAGNHALMIGSVMGALIDTPLLLFFVWGVRWWIALLATPLGFISAFPGIILYLCAFQVVRRLFPSYKPN